MNKTEFIKLLAARTGQSQHDTARHLDLLLALVSDTIGEGNDITIPDFGKLSPRTVAAHQARNPQTGAPVDVPEKVTVRFKPYIGFFTYSHKYQ